MRHDRETGRATTRSIAPLALGRRRSRGRDVASDRRAPTNPLPPQRGVPDRREAIRRSLLVRPERCGEPQIGDSRGTSRARSSSRRSGHDSTPRACPWPRSCLKFMHNRQEPSLVSSSRGTPTRRPARVQPRAQLQTLTRRCVAPSDHHASTITSSSCWLCKKRRRAPEQHSSRATIERDAREVHVCQK